MRKAIEMLEELNKMEFWVEDANCVTDSDPIEYVLECLLKGKEITVGVHKDFRKSHRTHRQTDKLKGCGPSRGGHFLSKKPSPPFRG